MRASASNQVSDCELQITLVVAPVVPNRIPIGQGKIVNISFMPPRSIKGGSERSQTVHPGGKEQRRTSRGPSGPDAATSAAHQSGSLSSSLPCRQRHPVREGGPQSRGSPAKAGRQSSYRIKGFRQAQWCAGINPVSLGDTNEEVRFCSACRDRGAWCLQ